MSTVGNLISKQRAMNAPPEPEPRPPEPEPKSKLDELLDAALAAPLYWETFDVVLAGEELEVSIARMPGRDWVDLEASNPPRKQADLELGYDRHALALAYPDERIKLAGETTTAEQWSTVYELLDPENIKNIHAVIWWLNIGKSEAELEEIKQNEKVRQYQHAHAVLRNQSVPGVAHALIDPNG